MCSKFVRSLALLAAVSCSVLEDRSECPCRLYLDFSSLSCKAYDSLCYTIWGDEGEYEYSSEFFYEGEDDGVTVPVSCRGDVYVAVYPGDFAHMLNAGACTMPGSEQAVPLYSYHGQCDTRQESAVLKVEMHKQFCTLTLEFVTDDSQKYLLAVESSYAGMTVDGRPLEAKMKFHVPGNGSEPMACRLPRQNSGSDLKLLVADASGHVRIFALGMILESAGYDWTAADLEDVYLRLDYKNMAASVSAATWEEEVFVPVVI